MIKAKKSLGQHFLSDRRIIDRIIEVVSPEQTDAVIEIGPGAGAITRPLAARAGFVVAIEADPRLVAEFSRADMPANLEIIEGDALSVDWGNLIDSTLLAFRARGDQPAVIPRIRIVANLPYYISTPILQLLIDHRARIFDITVMLQEEVVDRIASRPGSREYGYLSVLTQFYCEVQKLFDVPPSAFKPAPEVRSAVVRLKIRQQPAAAVEDEKAYFEVVKAAFAHRRKTLGNNLKAASRRLAPKTSVREALEKARIDPRRRAETLSLEEFASLCGALYGSSLG